MNHQCTIPGKLQWWQSHDKTPPPRLTTKATARCSSGRLSAKAPAPQRKKWRSSPREMLGLWRLNMCFSWVFWCFFMFFWWFSMICEWLFGQGFRCAFYHRTNWLFQMVKQTDLFSKMMFNGWIGFTCFYQLIIEIWFIADNFRVQEA